MANLYIPMQRKQNGPVQKSESEEEKKKYRQIHSIYDWYHPDQTETSARDFLDQYPYDPMDQEALFLVHPYGKYRDDIKYVISCKWKMEVYQYRVRYKEDEDVYTVRSAKANSLLDLVEQYRLAAVGQDGLMSFYTRESALNHLMYPIPWPHKYKDRCYHGLLGREEAEKVLLSGFESRDSYSPFLIRDSNSEPGVLILSSMFVKKSDKSHTFEHRRIDFKEKKFGALDCKEESLQALASSIEQKYQNRGELMDLKALNREGFHGVDTDVLEHHLPPSIKKMDASAIKIFREALEEGQEKYHHVRVMVVGHHGAGKSSLTKRLLKEKMEEVQSTEGVEIYNKRGRFQLSDHKWIKFDDIKENENEKLERIARHLTQRFPEGVPTYMSIREFTEKDTGEEKTNPNTYASTVANVQTKFPTTFPKQSETRYQNTQRHRISPPAFKIKPDIGRESQNDQYASLNKVPYRNSPPASRTSRGIQKQNNALLPPEFPPRIYNTSSKTFPDPRVSTSQSLSSDDSDGEYDDFEIHNTYLTRVLQDLKTQFTTSNGSLTPPTPDDEEVKGSDDYVSSNNRIIIQRGSSIEQALKKDLEELLQMSSNFLQNETGSITFWDFAGSTVFHSTHQAFMSSKAVYLLVTDASLPMNHFIMDDDDGQKSVGAFLKFWLNTIHTYSSESQRGSPKVLVVSTHRDKLQNAEKEIEEHHRDIKRVVKKKMLSPHLVPEMFCVDCNDPDEETFDKIRSEILGIAEKEDILSQQIPASWIYLERKIMDLRKEGKKVLNFSEVKQLNRFCALHLKDEMEIKVFLQFHHAIGNVLYYDEKGLDDIIILNPQWLVDAFKCLITSDKFLGLSPSQSVLEEMKTTGHLSMENIETLWSEREDKSYLENKEHIIKILERMDIISRPKRYMKDGESVQEMTTFLVPCMMAFDSLTIRAKWLKSANNVPALGFYFKDEFMPPAVFYRLLATCMTKFPVVEQNDIPLVFANTAVFRLDKFNFLLLAHDDFLIRVWVLRLPNTSYQKSSLHYTIKNFLEESLAIILEIYTSCSACPDHKLTKRCPDCRKCNANFPFRVVIQCSQCTSSDATFKGLHLWEDLKSNESVVCSDHDEVHVIESSDVLAFWECPKVVRPQNSAELTVTVLEKPLQMSYQVLGRLARRVSNYWEKIAHSIDFDDEFVETTKQKFCGLEWDCCFHMLSTWFDKTPKGRGILRTLEDTFTKLDIDRDILKTLDTISIEFEDNKYLDKKVSNRGIDVICNRLGKKSYQLAIELGLTPVKIEVIQKNFRTSIARSREYIDQWRQQENPTYKDLLQALAEVEVDNYIKLLSFIY
ncbi:uncharacterized protein LOC134240459 isoform X2 [Saccostrea cucullata]|uniref:uncharacterized protein LOC134240459 isoform X2 n=1 Tax=Saccostrea cuccullata TaxID=36930 RepID=UPI002ED6BEEE